VIHKVTSAHRQATMATLRVAFLSALALELTAALAAATGNGTLTRVLLAVTALVS
jgi:ABC-type transport system involved in cytochrome bd biosynthesis fused ATPase/permease subunit